MLAPSWRPSEYQLRRVINYAHIGIAVVATLVLTLIVTNLTTGEKKIDSDVKRLYSVTDPQYLRSMGVLLGPAILEGNRVEHLKNGDEIFPAMLDAIRSAKKTITFETYIYWSGEIGNWFDKNKTTGLRVMGPAIAPLSRPKGDHRYHFVLKSANRSALNESLRKLVSFAAEQKIPRTNLIIDVDAVSLM